MNSTLTRDCEEYWSCLWKEGQSIWQQKGVTKLLEDNKEVILAGKSSARVFIPLCGKARELKWFYDLGHTVIGVEFVEECVRSYFTDNDLQFEEATCPITECKILRTTDHRLQIFVCDIMDFKRECAGAMDIVWDRSGFTAMRVENRARYAAVIKSLLAPNFSYGMWTVVYDVPTFVDTVLPRSAGEYALREHFGLDPPRPASVHHGLQERLGPRTTAPVLCYGDKLALTDDIARQARPILGRQPSSEKPAFHRAMRKKHIKADM
ncbi:probable thiopurine S-methyltransferase [Dermacentor silvarum]|uniref:probable thiopurine S-methyltransferase n=1 Tax=Dermacentor silvarum TaxID=543639 RepID=UPI002100A829|nr:probable thiopurine S-methyltransferase [Dermacentor silvarum]